MDTASYSLAYSMSETQVQRLETATENLANAITPGYKRGVSGNGSFDAVLDGALDAAEVEGTDTTSIDFSQGALKVTDRALDFAIVGDGFFTVESDSSEYYTRNGAYMRAGDGTLMTTSGYTVAGEAGPITIPENVNMATLTVDGDGTIRSDVGEIGKLKIVSFESPELLARSGRTLFSATATTVPLPAENGEVVNRTLEGSNTSIFQEMAELITCTRTYEASQKMLKALDSAEATLIKASTG